MRFVHVIAAAALTAVAFAVPAPPDSHVIHEIRTPREGWQMQAKLESSILLPVRIGLTQSNLHRGDELLHDVSVPPERLCVSEISRINLS